MTRFKIIMLSLLGCIFISQANAQENCIVVCFSEYDFVKDPGVFGSTSFESLIAVPGLVNKQSYVADFGGMFTTVPDDMYLVVRYKDKTANKKIVTSAVFNEIKSNSNNAKTITSTAFVNENGIYIMLKGSWIIWFKDSDPNKRKSKIENCDLLIKIAEQLPPRA